MRAGLLDGVLDLVDPLGHRAEVLFLLAVGVGADLVQVLVGVVGVAGLVVGLGVVRGIVGAPGVAGQERHQLTRVRPLGDLTLLHQLGKVDDVLVRDHVVGSGVGALVLGDVEEDVRVVGVVDQHVRGQPLGAVLQVVGGAPVSDYRHRVGPIAGVALDDLHVRRAALGPAGLLLHRCRLHGQVGGVGVRAQPTDVGEFPPEGPLPPLAGAVPVRDRLVSVAGTLEDHHVVGAVVAVHRGHDPARGDVLDVHRSGGLQAHRLLADVLPGRRADRGVGLHQVHVLGEPGVQALVHEVADPVDVGVRVVPELGHRVVVVVGGGGDVDVTVRQTGGPVGAILNQIAPAFTGGEVALGSAGLAAVTPAEKPTRQRGSDHAE